MRPGVQKATRKASSPHGLIASTKTGGSMNRQTFVVVAAVVSLTTAFLSGAQTQPMGFFITSAGSGDGANLGGLAGADKQCQTLAEAAGVGNKTWHAYLSASGANGQPAVN